DKVTSLKFLRFLTFNLETPYFVSYNYNGLLTLKKLFGLFDIRDSAGLEPLTVVRQAEETILGQRLVPQDFDGEFSIGRVHQNARMQNADAGDDIGRFPVFPANRVARLDEQVVFAFVMPDSLGLGLREKQNVHLRIVPMPGQPVQGAFLLVPPDDVTVDGEKRFAAQKRQRFFQSAAGFQRFGFLRDFNGQAANVGDIGGELVLEVRDVDDDLFDAIRPQFVEGLFNHRLAGDRDERFGHPVGQRLQ